jgi:hypothetical protein
MPSHSSRPMGALGRVSRARRVWRGWRLSRPFWGALLVIAAGAEVLSVRLVALSLHPAAFDTVVPVGIVIALALVLCGLLLWFHPVQRSLYSTAAILLAIVALMTAHLGGYLIGTLLGAVGGSVAYAWVPGEQPELRSRHAKASRGDGPGPALTLIIGDSEGGPGDEGHGPALPGGGRAGVL